ncbi:DUF2243 domain-containing protein [Terribacillus saccharophilus]|uniref:DUF2243 domain-containing protein n=1 Tax=Terribacillus saccharophilus TaxID=361277 RepID=UPI003982473B
MEEVNTYKRRNIISGFLFGVGLVAFIDEVVFHQLLHWHHFYDLSSSTWGLISDGFFHALSWFATVGGLFLFADLRRRKRLIPLRWFGAVCLGSGVFQLYDGLIQHKVLRIHQIRYGVDIFYYDLIWNGIAVVLIVAGIVCVRISRRKHYAE